MLLAVQLVWLARPAYACGCGAMVVDRKTTLAVNRETSAVRWDGRHEQIVMSLTVNGTAPDAAWIMPVPHRATVELGDSALFSELAGLTAPAVRTRHYFWPRSSDWPFGGSGDMAAAPPPGASSPGVGVVGRERLGPFDVARLTATDPDALRKWLKTNGFQLPSALATELRPYVARKWEYVAVRLAPASPEKRAYLTGTLDPLRLSFASDRLVYPMRLSRLAKTPQSLGLYVFAPHRMEPRSAIGGSSPEVFFAGRVKAEGKVRELAGHGTPFMTAIDQTFAQPERISGDHELRRVAGDTPYQRVTYTYSLLKVWGMPAWILVLGGVSVLAWAAVAVIVMLRSRRRRAAPAATG
ncbi:DUF2330 domain-containing protein [Streptomyces piniterrae]|uniref:DUF2330 domain-containing protein n=1 Tax=Streptomyces piniterrae TaxID=2571125 RepID=A0A4U0NNV7_9ACTN|nr:DUF2330 domain-containing protein [Streptomyces piniterrae]TJZ56105.1 DUF2330 domain-containing protein [Streptomyces piniterrae]